MKRSHSAILTLVVASLLATSASALERALDRSIGGGESEWNGGGGCQTLQYWNSCVGWTWTWTGWSPGDRIGVHYTTCDGISLTAVDIITRFTNGVPVLPGYGFSATLEAFAAYANGCLTGPSLGSAPFLPDGTTQAVAFTPPVVVPSSFNRERHR
jgi:hypothetical protein